MREILQPGPAPDKGDETRTPQAPDIGELLALAQRASRAGIWDLNLKTRIVHYCPRSLEILGHSPDRSPFVTAEEWASKIYPGDAERVLAEGARARASSSDFAMEYRVIRPDGSIGWVRGLGRTLLDEEGQPTRSVGFNFDITEQKQAEENFRQMQSELIHVSRMSAMGTMAETLAHELNQPLTSITNYLSGARKLASNPKDEKAGKIKEALSLSLDCAHRAGEVIRRLRAMTRRGKTERIRADLAITIGEAAALALVDMEAKGLATTIDLSPNLWVEADHIQIQQVVLNLVRNAVEAMANSDARKLVISAHVDRTDALVRIEDSGSGVSEDVRKKLFEPFVSAKPGGMGVGLSISRTIVEAHAGQLWSEKKATPGAVFCFTLPLVS